MRLPLNEVEWSLFLPFLKLDAKSHRVIAGVSVQSDDINEAFVETDDGGLLPLADLKRELGSLSDGSAPARGVMKNIASGALHPRLGDPAKAWWISARIDDPGTWQQIRTGQMTGLHLRGRAVDETRKHDVSNELRLPKGQPGGGQWTTGSSTGAATPAPTESAKPSAIPGPASVASASSTPSISSTTGMVTSSPTLSETSLIGANALSAALPWSLAMTSAASSLNPLTSAVRATSFFGPASPLALEGLEALLTRVSTATAFLGIILIPSNKNQNSDGTLPDHPAVTYHYDDEARTITLSQGGNLLLTAERDGEGLLRSDDNTVIGRAIAGSGVVLDDDEISALIARWRAAMKLPADAKTIPRVDPDPDDPKVCPDAGDDKEGQKKLRALAYEGYIHFLVNPVRPLAPGQAVFLGDRYFDDCYRENPSMNGTMVEAKGEGYLKLSGEMVDKDYLFPWQGAFNDMMNQAKGQVAAAGDRPIVWYFAEKEVADLMRSAFTKAGFSQITIIYQKPPRDYIETYGPKDYKKIFQKFFFLDWISYQLVAAQIYR